jgi:hypothetical protein
MAKQSLEEKVRLVSEMIEQALMKPRKKKDQKGENAKGTIPGYRTGGQR